MTEPRRSRRAYLAGLTAVGAPLLAGCPSDAGSDGAGTTTADGDGGTSTGRPSTASSTAAPTSTTTAGSPGSPGSTTSSTPTPGNSVRIAGQLVDESGEPITSGRIYAVGGPEDGLLERGPNEDGQFGFELTVQAKYAIQYGNSPEGLPDHFTVAVFRPEGSIYLGRTTIPEAYPVDVAVETADGTDVTGDSRIRAWHTNPDGDQSWVDVAELPVELANRVQVGANYEGTVVKRSLQVTSPTSVTLTVDR